MRIFKEQNFRDLSQILVNTGIGEVHKRLINMSLSDGIDYIIRLKKYAEDENLHNEIYNKFLYKISLTCLSSYKGDEK